MQTTCIHLFIHTHIHAFIKPVESPNLENKANTCGKTIHSKPISNPFLFAKTKSPLATKQLHACMEF